MRAAYAVMGTRTPTPARVKQLSGIVAGAKVAPRGPTWHTMFYTRLHKLRLVRSTLILEYCGQTTELLGVAREQKLRHALCQG